MLHKTLHITHHIASVALCSIVLIGSLLPKSAAAASTENTVEFLPVPPQLINAAATNVITILADTSGSMQWLAGPEGYQPDKEAAQCPTDLDMALKTNKRVTLRFNSQGDPYFRHGNENFAWGTTPGTDPKTGYPFKCFHTYGVYNAIMSTVNTKVLSWTGNELNYAFDPDSYSTNSTTSLKGMDKRTNVLKQALLSVIDEMDDSPNMLGLARLNYSRSSSSRGARLLVYPDIVANNRNQLINAINSLPANGGTPLASAHAQIMRFMVQGHNEELTYRDKDPKRAYDILSKRAINSMGVSDASPIKDKCHQPSLIMLTDGLPEGDSNVPSTLMSMTNGVVEGNIRLARSADFGAQVDSLIPSISDDLKMKTYLLIFANQVLFDSPTVVQTGRHGLGGRFYASNKQSLIDAFKNILISVSVRTGTLGLLTFANQNNVADNKIYVAKYDSGNWSESEDVFWSGDVLCHSLDDNGNISADSCWSAKEKLAAKSSDSRTMITSNNSTGGVAFEDNLTVLNPQMQADLNSDGQGLLRMQLLRDFNLNPNSDAQRSNFRTLPTIADILGGQLQYIGPAISQWNDRLKDSQPELAKEYDTFIETAESRTPFVCSGGDSPFGRQCFDAQTGEEILAYAPGNTTRISNFLSLNYTHSYYNSGPSVIDDTVIDDEWKTLYVFCGGSSPDKQCSALNVTTGTFSEANATDLVVWDVSDAQIPELGNVITVPTIVLHDKTPNVPGNVESFTIIPNGYNSNANKACIIAIRNKSAIPLVRNSDYYVICDANTGDAALSVRGVDSNNDGLTDHLYIGTSQGKILRVDTTGKSLSSWTIDAKVADLGQPITSKPLVVKPVVEHHSNTGPGLIVLVGTGRFFTEADRYDTTEQYFVSLLDDVDGFNNSIQIGNLLEQTLADAGNNLLSLTNNTLDYNLHRGAFIRLSDSYRIIDGPQLYGNYVTFNIIKPGQANPICAEASNGDSKFVIADAIDLSHPDEPMFDANEDGFVNQADLLEGDVPPAGIYFENTGIFAAPKIIGNFLFEGSDSLKLDQDGNPTNSTVTIITLAPPPTSDTGRRSWQELRKR